MNPWKKNPLAREQAKVASHETEQTVRSNQRQMDRDIRVLDRQEKLLLQKSYWLLVITRSGNSGGYDTSHGWYWYRGRGSQRAQSNMVSVDSGRYVVTDGIKEGGVDTDEFQGVRPM